MEQPQIIGFSEPLDSFAAMHERSIAMLLKIFENAYEMDHQHWTMMAQDRTIDIVARWDGDTEEFIITTGLSIWLKLSKSWAYSFVAPTTIVEGGVHEDCVMVTSVNREGGILLTRFGISPRGKFLARDDWDANSALFEADNPRLMKMFDLDRFAGVGGSFDRTQAQYDHIMSKLVEMSAPEEHRDMARQKMFDILCRLGIETAKKMLEAQA